MSVCMCNIQCSTPCNGRCGCISCLNNFLKPFGLKKELTVYIASPYTIGDIVMNVRQSIKAANVLVDMGIVPFVPLLSHFWHMITPRDYHVWLHIDNEWVIRSDAVLRLPGESKGADQEVSIAQGLGKPVFFGFSNHFDEWVKQNKEIT